MATFGIVPGGVYAKADEVFAREVIEITSEGDVIYNDSGPRDGTQNRSKIAGARSGGSLRGRPGH